MSQNKDQNGSPAPAIGELKDNQLRLTDGRVITIRELTGLDELMIVKIVGQQKGNESTQGYVVLTQMVSCWYSVAEIDGVPVVKPTSMDAINKLAAKFLMKDTGLIMKKYSAVNVSGEAMTPPSNSNTNEE